MNVRFADRSLRSIDESDSDSANAIGRDLVKAFRKRMQLIRAAPDERVLYAFKSLHFERLKGSRADQYSMRLNDQWRLIVELEDGSEEKTVVIVGIEDYH